jgi:hypothetical protein
MASSVSSSSQDFSLAANVYDWFVATKTKPATNSAKELAAQVRAFMAENNLLKADSGRVEVAFRTAIDALSFVEMAHHIRNNPRPRDVSKFTAIRVGEVFDKHVHRDHELIFAGPDQVKTFSEEWRNLHLQGASSKAFDVGMGQIQMIVDTETNPLAFAQANDLFKLGRDPRLASLDPRRLDDFMQREYPFLAQPGVFDRPLREVVKTVLLKQLERDPRFEHLNKKEIPRFIEQNYPFLAMPGALDGPLAIRRKLQPGGRDLISCINECVVDKNVVRGAILLKAAYTTAVVNPERVEYDIGLVNDNWETVNRAFSRVTPHELALIPRDLLVPPIHMGSVKPLVLLGFGLSEARKIDNLDPYNRSLLTPLQTELWDKRRLVIERGANALQGYIDQMVRHECDLYPIQERVQPYIDDRNELHVTKQFEKDGHRYGQLVITRSDGQSVLFPGNNTREACRPVLLDHLRGLATIGDHLDPVLFATLQESICQNMEKPATQERIRRELEAAFGPKDLVGFVPVIWGREFVCVEKIDDTHFKMTSDYTLIIMNPETGVKMTRKIRLEFPINAGDAAGVWNIGIPHWSPLPDLALNLSAAKHAVPLAALAPPQLEPAPAKVDKAAVVVSDDEEEIDWDVFNASQRADK